MGSIQNLGKKIEFTSQQKRLGKIRVNIFVNFLKHGFLMMHNQMLKGKWNTKKMEDFSTRCVESISIAIVQAMIEKEDLQTKQKVSTDWRELKTF